MSIHELFLTLSLFLGANDLVLSKPNKTTTNTVQPTVQPKDTIKSTVPKRIISLEEFLKQSQSTDTLSLEMIYSIPNLFFVNNIDFNPAKVRNNYSEFMKILVERLQEDGLISSYEIKYSEGQLELVLKVLTNTENATYVLAYLKNLKPDDTIIWTLEYPNNSNTTSYSASNLTAPDPKAPRVYVQKTILPAELAKFLFALNINYSPQADKQAYEQVDERVQTTVNLYLFFITELTEANLKEIKEWFKLEKILEKNQPNDTISLKLTYSFSDTFLNNFSQFNSNI